MENERLYQKDWLMWLLFAFFSPVGIILMWINKRYKPVVRILISIFYFLLFIGEYGAIKDGNVSSAIFVVVIFILIPYLIVHKDEVVVKISQVVVGSEVKQNDFSGTSTNKESKTPKQKNKCISKVVLFYEGGYPEYPRRFNALITRDNNSIVFISQNTDKEKFRVSKDEIINVRYDSRNSQNYSRDLIVVKLKYDGNEIELLFNGGFFSERNYSKLMSLIYSKKYINISDVKKYNNNPLIISFVSGIIILILIVIGINSINRKHDTIIVDKPKTIETSSNNKSTFGNTGKEPDSEFSKVQTETQKRNTYYAGVRQYAGILTTDVQNINDAIPNLTPQNMDKIKQFSDFIVEDCENIKKLSVPDTCKDEADKINRACDIYIDIYSNFYNNFQNMDWLKNISSKMNTANTLIQSAVNESQEK